MDKGWLYLSDFSILKGKCSGDILFPVDGEVKLAARMPKDWTTFETAVAHIRTAAEHQPLIQFGLCTTDMNNSRLDFHYRILANCEVQVPYFLGKRYLDADMAFLPPWPGVFKGGIKGLPVSPEDVHGLTLSITGSGLKQVKLKGIQFMSGWQPEDVQGDALVDELGQCKVGDWPGKTKSLDELKVYLEKELVWARTNNRYPDGWSDYGGWKEKRFDATGWFHTVHDGRRWWLADPDGYAFFSNGMCYGNRTGIYAMADHLDNLYEWLPPHEGLFSKAWCTGDRVPLYVARNGVENARSRELVNLPRANMMRVFGEHWLDAWITINAARLHTWGVNTLGVGVNDYDDEPTATFLAQAKIPYVITLKKFPLTQQCVFRDFPDVFSAEYAALAAAMAREQLGPYRDDPYMIGYFITNEPEWLMHDGVNLAERLLAAEGCEASKRKFIEALHVRYEDIQALNAAWETDFDGFERLLTPWHREKMTEAAQKDMEAFHLAMVEKYGRVVSDALKSVDSHHLNLGMRYSQASDKTLCGPMNYFDVFSFNCYGAEPNSAASVIAQGGNMPMVVGEWHIGARDSGLDAWGLYYTQTQAERAQAVAYYLEQSTQERHLIGIHYFEYGDQPYLGRFDGECYNIGLIDVCNRPYPLVTAVFRDFAQRMYPMLDGQIMPSVEPVALNNIWDTLKVE